MVVIVWYIHVFSGLEISNAKTNLFVIKRKNRLRNYSMLKTSHRCFIGGG